MPELDNEPSEYSAIGSDIGNAFFSGLTFEQLWDCVATAENRGQLDAAIEATIKLKELTTKTD